MANEFLLSDWCRDCWILREILMGELWWNFGSGGLSVDRFGFLVEFVIGGDGTFDCENVVFIGDSNISTGGKWRYSSSGYIGIDEGG